MGSGGLSPGKVYITLSETSEYVPCKTVDLLKLHETAKRKTQLRRGLQLFSPVARLDHMLVVHYMTNAVLEYYFDW